jgi:NTE family protein
MACLHTLIGAHDAYHLNDQHVTERTIFVDCLGVTATQFDIDQATQQKLFAGGRQAAATFISNWPPKDFTAEGAWRSTTGG